LGLVGRVDGAGRLRTVHIWQRGNHLAIGGVGDLEGLAAIALRNPLTGDERLVDDEGRILELGDQGRGNGHGSNCLSGTFAKHFFEDVECFSK
jgi:hypothetical protein